ncbi:hypothetical protein DF186_23190, partial [Enterococcus hirae]
MMFCVIVCLMLNGLLIVIMKLLIFRWFELLSGIGVMLVGFLIFSMVRLVWGLCSMNCVLNLC